MLLHKTLEELVVHGELTVIDHRERRHRFVGPHPGHKLTIRFHDPRTAGRFARSPDLAVGEAYMDGDMTIEDGSLADLIAFGCANLHESRHGLLNRLRLRWRHARSRLAQNNHLGRARRNVAHHYDLSRALYDLFLDGDRQYSCAYFASPDEALETAQARKKRHIAAKLCLEPGCTVLDIGSGWGGMAIYLAELGASRVDGVTLSTEQHQVARARVAEAGLDDRVDIRLQDYRDVTGQYDRLVSVGMFEHVGRPHYETYFAKVRERLKEDGVMLLHSIGRMSPPGGTNPWLDKYIFPGGYTPALSEVCAAVEKAGLWITDIEILRVHYAETLRAWYERFMANRDRIRDMYDERFCRMWEFYLLGCEASFRYQDQMVFQMQIARRRDAVPLTRDYIHDFEQRTPLPGMPTTLAAE